MFVIEYLKTRSASQAAEALGMSPDTGAKLLRRDDVQDAISYALKKYYEEAAIDAEWLLMELVDNHYLARQQGNISASNQALNTIAKHAAVDAFAAEKMELATDNDRIARLLRGRKRAANRNGEEDSPPSFI